MLAATVAVAMCSFPYALDSEPAFLSWFAQTTGYLSCMKSFLDANCVRLRKVPPRDLASSEAD